MSLWTRIANVFRTERVNREIDEELEAHVAEAMALVRERVLRYELFRARCGGVGCSFAFKLPTFIPQIKEDANGPLAALWLPILLSATIAFVASSIMHMVLPYHKSDYRQLPEEDKLLVALRGAGLTRGLYVFPYCSHKDMKSPAIVEKYKQGPVGMMTVFPSGSPVMAKFLGLWFVYCLIIGFFVSYLTAHTVAPGATNRAVFRVAGTTAFMAYGLGNLSNSIWRGQPRSMTIKEVIDGLVYALLTAGTFGWLWPR